MIDIETATSDINRWLDHKKISERKRANLNDNIQSLVDAICDGRLIVNAENELQQKLVLPFGDEKKVDELKYKSRITIGLVQDYMKNVKAGDADGRITAYVAALTGFPPASIKKMDTEDYSIAQAIAIFFL